MVKIGDKLPAGTLAETLEFDAASGCPLAPKSVDVAASAAGKTIVIFAVPGAYTPTCSMQHLPGYVEDADALKAKGVDEIWCVAVNDPFVMAAWGRDCKATGKVRMLGDGSGLWTKALGLELNLIEKGLGMRSQRYSMLVKDGVVTRLNVEESGLKVSDSGTMLTQLG